MIYVALKWPDGTEEAFDLHGYCLLEEAVYENTTARLVSAAEAREIKIRNWAQRKGASGHATE